MNAWWSGITPVTAAMPCGSGHQARWERGELRVEGLDAEAEQVLAALGGTACRCVDLLRAWDGPVDPVEVVLLGPRTPTEPVTVDLGWLQQVHRERQATLTLWAEHRARAVAASPGRGAGEGPQGAGAMVATDPAARAWERRMRLLWLLALPGSLQRRLVAAAAHTVERDWDQLDPRDRARVGSAVTGRLRDPLRRALAAAGLSGVGPGELAVAVDVEIGPPATTPHVGAVLDGEAVRLTGQLGVDWLRAVWARDLATMGEGIGLEVTTVTDDQVRRGRWARFELRRGNTQLETVVEEWDNGDPPLGEPSPQE